MNIFQHLVSFVAIMANQRDPYPEEYTPEPDKHSRDEWRHVVTEYSARNYIEATDRRGGMTIEGDGYKTATKIGKNRWRAGFEGMATEKYQRPGETKAERAARHERLRQESRNE